MDGTEDKTPHNNLDNRLGAPLKKREGLSCDEKKAESEHLHAFREDVPIGNDTAKEESKEGESCANPLNGTSKL